MAASSQRSWRDGMLPGIPRVGRVPVGVEMTEADKRWWMYGAINTWPTEAHKRYLARNEVPLDEGDDDDEGGGLDGYPMNFVPDSEQVRADVLEYAEPTGWTGPGCQGNYTHYDTMRTGSDFYSTRLTKVTDGSVFNSCGIRHWAFGSDGKLFLNSSVASTPVDADEFKDASYVELARNVRVVSCKNLTPSALALCSHACKFYESRLDVDDVYVTLDGTQIWEIIKAKMRKAQAKALDRAGRGENAGNIQRFFEVEVIEIIPKNMKPFEICESERDLYTYAFSPKELHGISYTEQAKVVASRGISSVETITALLTAVKGGGKGHPEVGKRDVSKREFYSKKKNDTVRRPGFKNAKGTKMQSRLGLKTEGFERALLARVVAVGLPENLGLGQDPLFQNAVLEKVTSFPDVCPSKLSPEEKKGISSEVGAILRSSGNCRSSSRGMGALKEQTYMDTHDFLDKIYGCPILQATLRFLERKCPGFMSFAELINPKGLASCKGDVLRTLYVLLCYIYYVRTAEQEGEDCISFSRAGQKALSDRLKNIVDTADLRLRYLNKETDVKELTEFDMDEETGIPLIAKEAARPFGSPVDTVLLPDDVVRLLGPEGISSLTGQKQRHVPKIAQSKDDNDEYVRLLRECDEGMEAFVSYVTGTKIPGVVAASASAAAASAHMVIMPPKAKEKERGIVGEVTGRVRSGGSNVWRDTHGHNAPKNVAEADRMLNKAVARSRNVRAMVEKDLDKSERAASSGMLSKSQRRSITGTRQSLRQKQIQMRKDPLEDAGKDDDWLNDGVIPPRQDPSSLSTGRRKRGRVIEDDDDDDDEDVGGSTDRRPSRASQAELNNCSPPARTNPRTPPPNEKQKMLAACLAASTDLPKPGEEDVDFQKKAGEIGGNCSDEEFGLPSSDEVDENVGDRSRKRGRDPMFDASDIADYESLPPIPTHKRRTGQIPEVDRDHPDDRGHKSGTDLAPVEHDSGSPETVGVCQDRGVELLNAAGIGAMDGGDDMVVEGPAADVVGCGGDVDSAIPTPRGALNVLADSAIQAEKESVVNANRDHAQKPETPQVVSLASKSDECMSGADTVDDTPIGQATVVGGSAGLPRSGNEGPGPMSPMEDRAMESIPAGSGKDDLSVGEEKDCASGGRNQNETKESVYGGGASANDSPVDSDSETEAEVIDFVELSTKVATSMSEKFPIPSPVNCETVADSVVDDDKEAARVFKRNVKRSRIYQDLMGSVAVQERTRPFMKEINSVVSQVLLDNRPRVVDMAAVLKRSGDELPPTHVLNDKAFHRALGSRYSVILSISVAIRHYFEQRCWREHIRGRKGRNHFEPGWFEKEYVTTEAQDEYALSYIRALRGFYPSDKISSSREIHDYSIELFRLGSGGVSIRGVGLTRLQIVAIHEQAAVLYEEMFRMDDAGDCNHSSKFTISIPRGTGIESSFPWLDVESGERSIYPGGQKFRNGSARFTKVEVRGRRVYAKLHDLFCSTRWESDLRADDLEAPHANTRDIPFGRGILDQNAEVCVLEMHSEITGAWVTPLGDLWDYDGPLMKAIICHAQGTPVEDIINSRSSSLVVQIFAQKCVSAFGAENTSRLRDSEAESQQGRLMVNLLPQAVASSFRRLFGHRGFKNNVTSSRHERRGTSSLVSGGQFRLSIPLRVGIGRNDLLIHSIVDPCFENTKHVEDQIVISSVVSGNYGVHSSPVLPRAGIYGRRELEDVDVRGDGVNLVRETDTVMPMIEVPSSVNAPHREYGVPIPIWESTRTAATLQSDTTGQIDGNETGAGNRRSCMNWRLAVSSICPNVFWEVEFGELE